MYKGYKYRIYPNSEQQQMIEKTFGICRLVYNLALETKIRTWQSMHKSLSAIDLCYQLTELKKEYSWMGDVDSQALQASIKKIDKSFASFYNGSGFPKFKNKKTGNSFQCPHNPRKINFKNSTLTIPKIKNIPIVLSRDFSGQIRTITISKTSTGKYFASILVETSEAKPVKSPIIIDTTIGIDLGIKTFVVTSDGRFFEPNRKLKENLNRLRCLQRRASRKKQGSGNRKKENKRVSIIYEKINNQRADYIHKITSQLIRDSQTETFVIEDLAVSNMLKNRKLSQAISDVAFGEFIRQMKYKCDWYGKNIVVIGRFDPSSKRCSGCGEINKELTLIDRNWVCVCGAAHERDLNAAKNIKYFGLNTPVGSRGEPVESRRLRRAKKQESSMLNI